MRKLLPLMLGVATLCPAQPQPAFPGVVSPAAPARVQIWTVLAPRPSIDTYQLTHAWRFDEKSGGTLRDHVGIVNGALTTPHWVTQGLDFVAATADRVEFPNFVNPGTDGAFSMMVVANVVDTAGTQTIFSQAGASGTGRSWMYLDASEELESLLGGTITAHGTAGLRGWHSFLLAYEPNGTLNLCVDCSCTSARRVPESNDGAHFLGTSETLADPFDEKMAYLLFYTRALTTVGRGNECKRNHTALDAILMPRGVRLPWPVPGR